MKKILFVCGLFILLTSCYLMPEVDISEDHQIVNAVLSGYFSSHDTINILMNTDPDIHIVTVKRFLDGNDIIYDSLLVENYIENNETIIQFDHDELLETARVIPNEDLDTLWARHPFPDSWDAFYDMYPGFFGYLEFSRPAIDPDGKMALIEYAWHGGYLSNEGYVVLLKKLSSGRWVVLRYNRTW